MQEVVSTFTGEKLGATYFRGSKPIDGIWATPNLVVTGACVMPAGYGVGDHRLFVVDFLTSSVIGDSPPSIIRSAARRLNTKIPGTGKAYSDQLDTLLEGHSLSNKLISAHNCSAVKEIVKEQVDKIDDESKQYMRCAEKKCRRIKSGKIPFSPESSLWIRRCQV